MQLKYSITENEDHQSFFVERKTIPYFGVDWHYHEEYELLYPIIGTGVRIVGDSMEYFNENIDINDKGYVTLDDWNKVKNSISPNCDDLLWQRIFYFALFMKRATEENDHDGITKMSFFDVCTLSYRKSFSFCKVS